MKKCWEEPRIRVQKFMPNEYVAACVTGTIQCAVPGPNPYACDGGRPTRYFDYRMNSNRWDGPTISSDGLEHGLCGNTATISFDGDTGSGFERINGAIQRNRPIYNIEGYDLAEGYYNVTWQSNDGANEYNHYGTLHITNIVEDRPNHS